MSTEYISKINHLLASRPAGTILQSFWLKQQGYSLDLQKRYRNSHWLEAIGSGAMKRQGDLVNYEGALYALQAQSGMSIHAGAKTALVFLGLSHYREFSKRQVTLFGGKNENLPAWFKKFDWGTKVNYHKTSFLPPTMGIVEQELKSFSIKISNGPRALLECLYLVPGKQDLMECLHIMEGMNNVRPAVVQELLEKCNSIKVKRLFLYLAEKANHEWWKRLEPDKIYLGKGKRSMIRNGVYNSKYLITVSKELEQYDQRRI
jgi:hypothetical protein